MIETLQNLSLSESLVLCTVAFYGTAAALGYLHHKLTDLS